MVDRDGQWILFVPDPEPISEKVFEDLIHEVQLLMYQNVEESDSSDGY
jgi:hypothetical protein